MWTPKRIVLLTGGFVAFFTAYVVYSNFLGGIDGLPPLPACYLASGNSDGDDGTHRPPVKVSHLEEKLKEAFGVNCKELNRPLKLELQAKRTVLTADTYTIKENGHLYLTQLSLALFSADRGDGRGLEINTLYADEADLTFDKPIGSISEIGGRKIVLAELRNNIEMTNNHRTEARDDDLHVFIKTGPLYYDERQHLISTTDYIYLRDEQSKPKPVEIRGHALSMDLLTDAPATKPGTPAPRKQKSESVTGVKSIVLRSDVEMNLYVDGQSSFLGGSQDQAGKQAKTKAPAASSGAKPPEKAHVVIKTPGEFHYDLFKDYDLARFDVPEETLGRSPQDVTVHRYHESQGEVDQLVCKHLDLRLARKETTQKAGSSNSSDHGLNIETAHATGPNGMVTLASDAEKLRAHGNDFFYDATKQLTILKGQPMEADKDHNVIRARELQLQEQKPTTPGGKTYQIATAFGPGTVDLIDKEKYTKVMQATWRDTLVSDKDGPYDLLTLKGAAEFKDIEHGQTLQAETLKVWLQPKDDSQNATGTTAKPATQASGKTQEQAAQRPHKIEALKNVVAHSPQLNIHDTGRLIAWFEDVPASTVLPAQTLAKGTEKSKSTAPDALPVSNPRPLPIGPTTATEAVSTATAVAAAPAVGTTGNDPNVAFVGPAKPADPPRPIDLSARSVEAWILRCGERNTLNKLRTEGEVRVKQAPAKPDEKGVDIAGDTLEMNYHPEGNLLIVTGEKDLAQLRMDKIYIIGPEVYIDQAKNQVWVTGGGAMEMESKTNLQGNELNKTVPLEVYWNKSMLFDGRWAEFEDGVQAKQENGRLACQMLRVYFDRTISLKEGGKSEQPARVKDLVCDKDVRIAEATYDPTGKKLIKYQQITGISVVSKALEPEEGDVPQSTQTKDNGAAASTGNDVETSGPGTVRLFQQGDPAAAPSNSSQAPSSSQPSRPANSSSPSTTPNGAKPGDKSSEELKLTYVSFNKRMHANSKTNKAMFYENVRVLSFPCTNPLIDIDFDTMLTALPPGGMYLRCDQMEVLNRQVKGSKSQQEMTATGRVTIQSKEFSGRAAKVTYNEEKDQVILESGEDGYATLYKVDNKKGAEAQKLEGKKIIYLRRTGEYNVEGAKSVSGGN